MTPPEYFSQEKGEPMPDALTGRCTCGEVAYRLTDVPILTNTCHCSWCQRQTGSAFAINGMIETDKIEITQGAPVAVDLPSPSGAGQRVMRCPTCQVALWSQYLVSSPTLAYVRLGTLDDPGQIAPDVHIYTSTKQDWVELDPKVPAYEGFYRPSEVLPPDRYKRFKAAIGR